MKQIKLLKWASTVAVLTGIVLTNLNIFPLNIIIHGSGALGWTVAGYLTRDRARFNNLNDRQAPSPDLFYPLS